MISPSENNATPTFEESVSPNSMHASDAGKMHPNSQANLKEHHEGRGKPFGRN
jgi:hypothetical protein